MTGEEQAYSALVFLGIGDKNSTDRACGSKMCSAAGAGVDAASVDIDNANILGSIAELIGKLSEMYSEPILTLVEEPEDDEGNIEWGASF